MTKAEPEIEMTFTLKMSERSGQITRDALAFHKEYHHTQIKILRARGQGGDEAVRDSRIAVRSLDRIQKIFASVLEKA